MQRIRKPSAHPMWISVVVAAVAWGTGIPGAHAGGAPDAGARECADWLGNPTPGTPEWDEADLENQRCATEGLRILDESPAVAAAQAANAEGGDPDFLGDPFRAPHRWAERGSFELTTYTASDASTWSAALLGPPDADDGPHPGVVLVCHICGPLPATADDLALWYWAAQPLAEAGYVVMYAAVGGNSVSRATDATDFFVATPDAPTARGEHNPWHDRLDRDRLGIIGHSGAAGVSLTVGHTDERYDAIVAWDPARSYSLEGVTPRVPTMIVVADYTRDGTEVRPEKPLPEPGSRFTFYETIRDAGVDAMEVGVRASTHIDWTHFTGMPHSIYGEMVATYYTLAWLDRYLAPSRPPGGSPAKAERRSEAVAEEALERLVASGKDRFDRSADRYSIGAGFFDPDEAERAGDTESGNVPVTIGGIPVRNLLSFHYDSAYSLDGGTRECDDLRAGCPRRRRRGDR